MDKEKLSPIRRSLLAWYRREQRDLPWRQTADPYRIWVSEIMLQQTQVKTVLPYYERWLQAFPTVEKLARAREGRVLKLWEGLGYYTRARNMKKAAQVVVKQHGGRFPDSMEDILNLPGIGRYTAGAILSIAFGQCVPVLDGNVKRVLSRLFCLDENGATSSSENRLWQAADDLLSKKYPGDFNQALMELGATVCLPKNPLCLLCPVRNRCEAHSRGQVDRYPPPKSRTPQKKIEVSAGVILKNGKAYIQQRLHSGLMGGLWEFPGGKLEPGESPEVALKREIHEELGVGIHIEEKLMTIKHTYTRFRVTLHVFRCRVNGGRLRPTGCEQWKWVSPSSLSAYPFPAANVKIVRLLAGTVNNGQNRKR